MHSPSFPSLCLVASLVGGLAAQESAGPAAPANGTLTALAPITAAWLTSPPGSTGAVVTHPAGPLTHANVAAPVGLAWANFLCDLVPGPSGLVLTATSFVFAPPGEVVTTHADLLLTITAPATMVGSLDLGLAHFGDMPAAEGFRIDFDNDGSDEVDTDSLYCCGTLQRRVVTHSFVNGPWLVRVRGDNTLAASPQAYDMRLEFDLELAGVTDLGSDCGPPITTPPTTVVYSTNAQLMAFPSNVAGEFGVLRAVGFGHLGLFLFANTSAMAALPLPPYGSCDLLATALFGVPGTVTSGTAIPSEWEVHLPALPPGFTFHTQHAWLNLLAPQQLGASNVLRIDT